MTEKTTTTILNLVTIIFVLVLFSIVLWSCKVDAPSKNIDDLSSHYYISTDK